ncbi:spondin-1-like isoform X2 [Sitophilus oryzae]|uniref:Spondin-1 n=1 Tax=Sitophilus oryzae TaxID=7048 RepID=A0A6J2X4D9_SITOR|nr:spondin-1-like isoform X2 [Sitophilus oryzae]
MVYLGLVINVRILYWRQIRNRKVRSVQKSQVTLIWKAPPSNSGCVSLRALVMESREKWYETDEFLFNGPLVKTICEDFNENEDVLPEIEKICCSCDEAKYELAFEGKWVRNMHPKGFPEDIWTTRFGNIVGASHKINHEFWKEDSEASEGLKELAFNGSTKKLESELMANIANLRTVIKARGVAYPDITSSSYAIFKVDSENHLVSLVTKMIPSPDWIVGLSNMELCLSNCSWRQSRSVNLYPWDVGTDDALEYTESQPSTNPQSVITKITSSNPADPKSPFYDENGNKMNPIATIHFKLEKVIKKECDPNRTPPSEETEVEEDEAMPSVRSGCETTGWSQWSSCSVPCGRGHMTRNVRFKHSPGPNDCTQIKKEETVECNASCQSGEEVGRICPNIIWGAWSPCSVACGKGWKQRYRVPSDDDDEDEIDKECPNKEEVECYEPDC